MLFLVFSVVGVFLAESTSTGRPFLLLFVCRELKAHGGSWLRRLRWFESIPTPQTKGLGLVWTDRMSRNWWCICYRETTQTGKQEVKPRTSKPRPDWLAVASGQREMDVLLLQVIPPSVRGEVVRPSVFSRPSIFHLHERIVSFPRVKRESITAGNMCIFPGAANASALERIQKERTCAGSKRQEYNRQVLRIAIRHSSG